MSEVGKDAFCTGCDYKTWDGDEPVPVCDFFERLRAIGIVPTGEGKVQQVVGSPFRVPLPITVKLCCMDDQIRQKANISLAHLRTSDDFNQVLNQARDETFREAGLPGLSQSA